MSTSHPHPDFDALSAHHDGEAPEVAAHVAGCAQCRTTLRWLRTTSALVAGPVPPVTGAVREQALARALEALGVTESARDTTQGAAVSRRRAEPAPVPAVAGAVDGAVPRPARPEPATPITSARSRRRTGSGVWVGVGSAAAVLVAVVLGVGALSGGGGGSDDTATVAGGGQADQERTASALADQPGPTAGGETNASGSAAAGVDGGDLGEIADAAALVAGARPSLLPRDAGAAAPRSGEVAPADAAPTPKLVGTRPCEMEVRAVRPELGTVVYFATGRAQGVPVIVLGFAPAAAAEPVTLLALAQQEGCRVVLEAAGP